jgi:hypothetical protein
MAGFGSLIMGNPDLSRGRCGLEQSHVEGSLSSKLGQKSMILGSSDTAGALRPCLCSSGALVGVAGNSELRLGEWLR